MDWEMDTNISHLGPFPVDDECFRLYKQSFIKILECWNFEGMTDVCKGKNVRLVTLQDGKEQTPGGNDPQVSFEESLRHCLARQGEYMVKAPQNAGRLLGGVRLVMCDRPNLVPRMTMSRSAFEDIEREFDLHVTTLPALLDDSGSFFWDKTTDQDGKIMKIQIVLKVIQNIEISNCLLSLTYDVATGLTNALICGDGVLFERECDNEFGEQQKQLLAAIIPCGPKLWMNPLLLPVAVLRICACRTSKRCELIRWLLIRIENHLGVTQSGWSGHGVAKLAWPMDIDVKLVTTELHSLLPPMLFMDVITAWESKVANWLLYVAAELTADPRLGRGGQVAGVTQMLHYIASNVEGMHESLKSKRGRAQSQIDLLFSVVGQRDALTSKKASELSLEVARATKEDSIAMATFTFITAIFLPPTSVATLFSMGMFDWSDATGEDHGHLSDKFWIFWAVAVPLTALTMMGWYGWYRHADQKWQIRLDRVNRNTRKPVETDSQPAQSMGGNKREGGKEFPCKRTQHFGHARLSWAAATLGRKGKPHATV